MAIKKVIEILQEIRAEYPNLTNDEVLKILEIHTLMGIKVALNNGR